MGDTGGRAPGVGRGPHRLPYVGALDGLRAVCLLAVCVYHADLGWAPGGFLGVSTFFTLSGFLITALLLVESRSTRRVDLRRFWAARARRLLPAAGITLVLVVAYARWAATPTQRAGLRHDLWATFGLSTNWRLALSGRAYGGYTAAASPVQHVWSLAVEEQFYLVLPLLVVGVLVLARRTGRQPRALLGGAAAVLALASTAALVQAGRRGDAATWAYYATHTRAAELLAGVLLACGASLLPRARARRSAVAVVGCLAAGVLVASWATVDQRGTWLYSGGLSLYTLASVAVIAACLHPGPVRRLLDTAPLRGLGRISYGAYLYHWPLFSWLSEDRLGVGGLRLFAVQMGATVAVAQASARLLEMPIRRRERFPRFAPAPVGALAVLAVALTLVVPATSVDPGPSGIEVTAGQRVRAAGDRPPSPGTPTPTRPSHPTVDRVLLVGDSVPQQLAPFVAERLPAVEVRWVGAEGIGPLTDQAAVVGQVAQAVVGFDPDLVVVHFAGSYLHREARAGPYLDAAGATVADGSEEMFVAWREESTRLADIAGVRGATVAWALIPTIQADNWFGYLADTVDRFNDLYRDLPGVRILDWHALTGGADGFSAAMTDRRGRSDTGRADDGLHFTTFGNRILAETVADEVGAWRGRLPRLPSARPVRAGDGE